MERGMNCMHIKCDVDTNNNHKKPWLKMVHHVPIDIIEIPCNLGQDKKGVSEGPARLMQHGLKEQLVDMNLKLADCHKMHFDVNGTKDDRVSNVKRAKSVGKANEQIAKAVQQSITQNHFCVALGGDHSIAIGTIIGHARAHPNLAVVWIDAHADLNPPLASPSGNSHGMPVSFLLHELVEYIPKDLPGFEWAKPCLSTKDIVYIGLRDLDEAEKALIEKHNILAFTMREVTELGVDAVVRAAIQYLSPSETRPIHLSFDIDGLDPIDAASTGTPVPGGLLLREGVYITESLAATGHLQMIDMVEVNPTLGTTEEQVRTLQSACEIVGACFGKRNRKLMSPGYIIPKP